MERYYCTSNSNVAGISGFVLSCLALTFGWVPFIGGILWILGVAFSCIGLFYHPRGWAWAGFAISFAWIITFMILNNLMGTFAAFTLWPYTMW